MIAFLFVVFMASTLRAEQTLYMTVYSSRTTPAVRNTLSGLGHVSTATVSSCMKTQFTPRGNTSYYLLEFTPKLQREWDLISIATTTGIAEINLILTRSAISEPAARQQINPFRANIDRPYSMDRSTP